MKGCTSRPLRLGGLLPSGNRYGGDIPIPRPFRIGEAVSKEARAKYNGYRAFSGTGIYQGAYPLVAEHQYLPRPEVGKSMRPTAKTRI